MKNISAYKFTGILTAVLSATALSASAQDSTVTPTEPQADAPSQATAPGSVAPSTTPAPTTEAPDTAATPRPAVPPLTDQVADSTMSTDIAAPKDFMREAFLANEFSNVAAKMAVEKATTPELKAAAQDILDESQKTRNDMIAAVQGATSDMAFDQNWKDEHQQKLAELRSLEGTEFDAKYLETQGQITHDAEQLYSSFASTASDAAIKTYATNTLPVLTAQGDRLESLSQGGQ